MVIWYILSRFGVLYQEKSGKPVADQMQETKKHVLCSRIFRSLGSNYFPPGMKKVLSHAHTKLSSTQTSKKWPIYRCKVQSSKK
jgi:hypothetical protein